MRRLCLAILLLAGCGGSSSGGETRPEPPVDPCRAGPTAGCLADRQRACRGAGDRAHRLAYDTLPPVVVGPGGLVRVDHLGGSLFGVDSTRWLACFAGCPEGGPARVCFPLALPLRLSFGAGAGCRRTEREAPAWQGRASRALELACPDGEVAITYVPELDPARRDLVAAGAIDGGDLLARVGGLAVEMRAGAAVQSRLDRVATAGCDQLAPPAGYRLIADEEAFGDLESAASGPAAALATEVEAIRAALAVQAVARAKAELLPRFRAQHGEGCRTRGFDPDDQARLEACAAAMPETEAPFRAAVARETARLLAERRAEIDALTRKLLVAPVCRHYASRR